MCKTQTDQTSGHFLRRSSIFQIASGGKILDAVLEISAAALPAKFLGQLLQEDVLFVQLLADFEIPVRLRDRVCTKSPHPLRDALGAEFDDLPRRNKCLHLQRR